MEKLPNKDKMIVTQLRYLPDDDTIVQFATDGTIVVYQPFNPEPTSEEQGLEWSSLDLHDPYIGEYLPVHTVDSLTGLIQPHDDTPVVPEALLEEQDLIEDQDDSPEALDVTALIPERKARMQLFREDLQAYASYLLSERTELPEGPVIKLFNEDNAASVRMVVDPVQWLAGGLVTISWKNRAEVGITKEGPHIDATPLLRALFENIGIRYDTALTTIGDKPYKYNAATITPIDENMFVPDALERITEWTKHVMAKEIGPHSLMVTEATDTVALFGKLKRIAQSHGLTIGYRHRYVHDYVWGGMKHDFLLMSDDGRLIVPIREEGAGMYNLDETQLALEDAYRAALTRIQELES